MEWKEEAERRNVVVGNVRSERRFVAKDPPASFGMEEEEDTERTRRRRRRRRRRRTRRRRRRRRTRRILL